MSLPLRLRLTGNEKTGEKDDQDSSLRKKEIAYKNYKYVYPA